MARVAMPIGKPNLITGSPAAIGLTAILWPLAISLAAATPATLSPASSGRSAIATLSARATWKTASMLLQVHARAAVDQQRRPGDIARHVRGEKYDRPGEVFGLAEPAERHARGHSRALVGIGEVLPVDLRQDRAREHRIA